MTSDTVGIGVIGLDHWYLGYGLLYHLQHHPRARLAALADDAVPERGAKLASVYAAGRFYHDYRELLEDPHVAAVVVLSTTDRHEEIALDAMRARRPVMVGKPIATTLSAADRMIQASEKSGVPLLALASAPPAGDIVERLVRDGIVGEPYAAYYTFWATLPQRDHGATDPGWFLDPRHCAGGGFIDHAVYGAGLVRSYLQDEGVHVYGEMSRLVEKDLAGEDHGIAIVRFRRGGMAVLEATFTERVARHNRVMVIGSDGQLELHQNRLRVMSRRGAWPHRYVLDVPEPSFAGPAYDPPLPFPPSGHGTIQYVEDLIDVVLTGRMPRQTARGARANLELCLAAYASVAAGGRVALPLVGDVPVWSILQRL